jgi:3-oxoadipate enol-lactonase
VSFWVGEAAPEVRSAVGAMQRRALELQRASDAEAEVDDSVALGRIAAPALVITGERDHADFRAIARRLVEELADATAATVPGAQHLPALERPEETARLVVDFLKRI